MACCISKDVKLTYIMLSGCALMVSNICGIQSPRVPDACKVSQTRKDIGDRVGQHRHYSSSVDNKLVSLRLKELCLLAILNL